MNSYEATCPSTRKYLAPQMYFNVVAIIFGTFRLRIFFDFTFKHTAVMQFLWLYSVLTWNSNRLVICGISGLNFAWKA